jgi:uncharacterized protein YqjF (DUF2071 family)
MRWTNLLFAHWPVPVEAIRSRVPAQLEIDTFDGQAWLGIVPFRMEGVAPRFLPAVPGPSAFPELNVRTYVRLGRRRAVWFFSLDAGSRIAVEGARRGFHLPYYRATTSIAADGEAVRYESQRVDRRGGDARFAARYEPSGPIRAQPWGSLARFLTDRFGLFALDGDRVVWVAIRHAEWQLQPARAEITVNTMTSPLGIDLVGPPELLHFAKRTDVVAWWPRRVARRA